MKTDFTEPKQIFNLRNKHIPIQCFNLLISFAQHPLFTFKQLDWNTRLKKNDAKTYLK